MEKEEGRDRKEGEKKFRRLRVPRAHTRAAAYKWGGFSHRNPGGLDE